MLDERCTAALLTQLLQEMLHEETSDCSSFSAEGLPFLQVRSICGGIMSCFVDRKGCRISQHIAARPAGWHPPHLVWRRATSRVMLNVPQALCKTLAQLVAGSDAARQQCMGESEVGGPSWPEVAAQAREVRWWSRAPLLWHQVVVWAAVASFYKGHVCRQCTSVQR
jgi:hypothetical protein